MLYDVWSSLECPVSMQGQMKNVGSTRVRTPTDHQGSQECYTHGGPLLSGGEKIPVFLPRCLGMDFVNNLVTFLLSVEADLTQIPQTAYPRLSLPRPLPMLWGRGRMYFMATDLYAIRDHTTFQAFQLQDLASWSHVFHKSISRCHTVSLLCTQN